MPKVLIIAGYASSLYNFRGPLIKTLLQNHEVVTTAPFDSDEVSKNIEALGVKYIPNNFQRTGMNPLADVRATNELQKIIASEAPDVALAYTIKPVVYGLRAAQKAGVKNTYALITGLGSGFDTATAKQKAIYQVVRKLYRRALKGASGAIFQNPDDRDFFLNKGIIDSSTKVTVVNGSGVDLDHYTSEPPSIDPLRFLLVARMVREKGVELFVEAARRVKKEHPSASFELLGWVDENPNSLSLEQIQNWQDEGIITYHGTTTDVRPYIRDSSVFVLPTYYREGTPRTILESMAMQRAIITTDTPGCRETVENGRNGFLIPARDADALYDRIMYFIKSPESTQEMGRESLKIAKEKYDVHLVNKDVLRFMGLD